VHIFAFRRFFHRFSRRGLFSGAAPRLRGAYRVRPRKLTLMGGRPRATIRRLADCPDEVNRAKLILMRAQGRSDTVVQRAARLPAAKLVWQVALLFVALQVPVLLRCAQTSSPSPTTAKLSPAAAHFAAGQKLLAQHTPKLAEAEIRAGLKLAPRSLDGLNLLGMALGDEKEFNGAVEALQQALAIDPGSTETQINLIQAYLAAGRKEKGLALAHALSERAKDDIRAHFTLGVILAKQAQYGEAIHEFEAADALEPGTFEILHNLGHAYLESGDNEKALAILDRALKLSPDSVETLYFMAQAYANQGKDLDALDLIAKAHKLAPRNTDVVVLLARLSMRQSFYEDAIPLLEEGLKVDSRRPDLLAELGECYYVSGKVDQALPVFQTLLQVDSSSRAYAFVGVCYRHLGRFVEAEKYLQQGLKLDPQDVPCLYNLGFIASRRGKYELADKYLNETLQVDPNYAEALLELGNLKMYQRKFEAAVPLLRKAVELNPQAATVYYRLAIAERSLHQTEAAERDLKIFQTLSKDPTRQPSAFQHLYDYLGLRAQLSPQQKNLNDLEQLEREMKAHPDEPQNPYLLAEAYLKVGRIEDAKQVIAQLDQLSQRDFRTLVGVGVLLARYHLYTEAIARFQMALQTNPNSDDVWYDLADACFRKHDYSAALDAAQHVSHRGQKDTSYLALDADILAHLGRTEEAIKLLREEIAENPDQDQAYLSLALVYLRSGYTSGARDTLQTGLARTPDAGELLWGMGILSVMEGQSGKAEQYLEKSVDLLPDWPGSYSALGVLYFQTGQIQKSRETLERFRQAGPRRGLDVQRIEQALDAAAAEHRDTGKTQDLSPQAQQQFLQVALAFADQAP
jgi:tetratricopeptide (TPR) repeat protein